MTQVHFKNFKLLEPEHGELREGYELLIGAVATGASTLG
jgi:hypothetical protein